jgi:hypothetical protein
VSIATVWGAVSLLVVHLTSPITSFPPEEMDLDDDNDSLESMIDPSGAVEVLA